MKIVWTARATRDLKEIGRYIARDNPDAAGRWVARLRQRARELPAMPRSGRIVPELGAPEIREALVGAYRIVYRLRNDTITILTVFEGHRLLPKDAIPPG